MSRSTDVVLVGAGPIGIEIAVALKRAGVPYIHLDARQIGYTISWFAPQTRFFSSNERISIAGVPLQTPDGDKSTREQYLTYLRTVVEQFDLDIQTYEPVTRIDREADGFVVTAERAGRLQSYRCRRLVLATGGTDHPRRLGVPGENQPHVRQYLTDPHDYFRQDVLIVGGKNSAIEAAIRLHNAGARVALSYRRETLPERSIKYWLLPEINALIAAGRINAHFNTRVVEIGPTTVKLAAASRTSEDPEGGPPVEIKADFVLSLIGYQQDTTLFKMAGVTIGGRCQAPTYDERTMETNVPGVYVAGTAVGGTQDKYTVFIENCHTHASRIVAAITGVAAPAQPLKPSLAGLPES